MTVDLDKSLLLTADSAVRLREKSVRIEELDLYYGLYELKGVGFLRYLVVTADGDEMVCRDFEARETAEKFYDLVSENEVDTASFDGIAHDFLFANNML